MPQKSSGVLWLILGLVFGVLALGCCGFGSFSVWHTHGNVQMAQAGVDRNMREMEKLAPAAHLPQNRVRLQELDNMVHVGLRQEAGFKGDRMMAILLAATSLLPGLLAFVFLGIFAYKRYQSPANSTESKSPPTSR